MLFDLRSFVLVSLFWLVVFFGYLSIRYMQVSSCHHENWAYFRICDRCGIKQKKVILYEKESKK
jgi:hypothetical protein